MPPSWPPGLYDRDAISFFHQRLLEAGRAAAGWYAWYVVRRSEGAREAGVVGSAGFTGPPSDDGTVEIGYSVAPEHRGRGHATEAVAAPVERALAVPGVERVVAETDAGNAALIKVPERCGFGSTGAGGEEGHLRFERRRKGG